jgi:DNA helicase-2/ATP-dependent DNA helicase PcrA
VIVHNTKRIEKQVMPVRTGGQKVRCVKAGSIMQEASFIADEIQARVRAGKASYRDFTLLYRVNAKSRALEEALRYLNIPSKIIGGVGFYDRAVVKDILAYLRMLANPKDDAALSRIHDKPPRGLGERGLGDLYELAEEKDCGALYAIRRGWYKGQFKGRALDGIRDLKKLYKSLRGLPKKPVTPIMETVIEDSGYRRMVRLKMEEFGEYDKESHGPLAHLDELVRAAEAFDKMQGKDIIRFMEWTSLMQSTDEDTDDNRVLLMTCHAAKGLEFKNVYLVGCNEGVLPSNYAIQEDDVEEERRVFFVGTTRAEDNLTISYVSDPQDARGPSEVSRFIEEAEDTLEHEDISDQSIGKFTEWRVKSNRGKKGRRNYPRRGQLY